MVTVMLVLGLAAAVAADIVLRRRLAAAQSALDAALSRPPTPAPPRLAESRRERFGLVWFPTLTVDDGARMVLAASAGLPHCARCVRALVLSSATPEEWSCEGCEEKRPGTAADIQVLDSVVGEALAEFLQRHPGYRVAAGLAPRAPRVAA